MIASTATISTQHGRASTYILHIHQVHVMHGQIDGHHGKIHCNHGKLNENYGKSMNTFGKSMPAKTMEKSINSANGTF